MCQVRVCKKDHFKGTNGNAVRKEIKFLNALMLNGALSYDEFFKEKSRILKQVAVSHQPVIANLFII